MASVVHLNGEMLPPEEARISVFDRGFLYGDGVFETLRTYRGVPFAIDEHLARLVQSARIVALPLPVTVAQLRSEIEEAVRVAANPESYVRLMLTRGVGDLGLVAARPSRATRVVIVQPLPPQPRAIYADGVQLVTVATRRDRGPTSGAGAKILGYVPNMLALRLARERGAYDAVMVEDGHVLESTTANVFAVCERQLVTPPVDAGILAGITRALVLDDATRAGVSVAVRPMSTAELWTADELFITSSLREIVPIVRVDDHVVGQGAPGPITRALHRAFRASAGIADVPMPWEAS